MNSSLLRSSRQRREGGAALAVGLILLLVLTILAIATLSTSTLDLRMAANAMFTTNAFEATERGIDIAIQNTVPNTTTPTITVPATVAPGTNGDTYTYTVRFNSLNGVTAVPSGGFSLGSGVGFNAFHFDVTSAGTAASSSTTTATQSYYVVGPSG